MPTLQNGHHFDGTGLKIRLVKCCAGKLLTVFLDHVQDYFICR
jgi:hypothetical protein